MIIVLISIRLEVV